MIRMSRSPSLSSDNVPYYAEVYNRSGYKMIFDDDRRLSATDAPAAPGYDGGGEEYTIGAPRAKIFRRDEGTVTDLQSFKNILRYANYSDPYAVDPRGDVDFGVALCMRGDLSGNGTGGAGGCCESSLPRHHCASLNRQAVVARRRHEGDQLRAVWPDDRPRGKRPVVVGIVAGLRAGAVLVAAGCG